MAAVDLGIFGEACPPISLTPELRETPRKLRRGLCKLLEGEACEYAIGGALALGYWATPRSTIDVDVTLYLPLDKPLECLRLLERLGCEFDAQRAESTLVSHGFCQVNFLGSRLDVFLPLVESYQTGESQETPDAVGRR